MISDGNKNDKEKCSSNIRMVEFFSGIGGWRYGVESALDSIYSEARTQGAEPNYDVARDNMSCLQPPPSPLKSCTAYEISLQANNTYVHNFLEEKDAVADSLGTGKRSGSKRTNGPKNFAVHTKLVEQLKPCALDGKFDLWTMSPPCQPFTNTRLAKQNDTDDKRTAGFKALMQLLTSISDKPQWILLENVKGFVGSNALKQWYGCLQENGYSFKEYLLSSTQCGIPNNRKRYYMICERSNRFWEGNDADSGANVPGDNIITEMPGIDPIDIQPLSHFVSNELKEEDIQKYLIPNSSLEKSWSADLPIVSAYDTITYCFTAAYSRIIHKSSGSLILMNHDKAIADCPLDRSDMTQYAGRIRRFTPKELLAIFGFPNKFEFPDSATLEHRYKLIGNSVNVFVVARVAHELLKHCCQ